MKKTFNFKETYFTKHHYKEHKHFTFRKVKGLIQQIGSFIKCHGFFVY